MSPKFCRINSFVFLVLSTWSLSSISAITVNLYRANFEYDLFQLVGTGELLADQNLCSRLTLSPAPASGIFFIKKPSSDPRFAYAWNPELVVRAGSKSDDIEPMRCPQIKLKTSSQPEENLFNTLLSLQASFQRSVTANITEETEMVEVEMKDTLTETPTVISQHQYSIRPNATIYSLSFLITKIITKKDFPVNEADVFDDIFYTHPGSGIKISAVKGTNFQTIAVRINPLDGTHVLAIFGDQLPLEEQYYLETQKVTVPSRSMLAHSRNSSPGLDTGSSRGSSSESSPTRHYKREASLHSSHPLAVSTKVPPEALPRLSLQTGTVVCDSSRSTHWRYSVEGQNIEKHRAIFGEHSRRTPPLPGQEVEEEDIVNNAHQPFLQNPTPPSSNK